MSQAYFDTIDCDAIRKEWGNAYPWRLVDATRIFTLDRNIVTFVDPRAEELLDILPHGHFRLMQKLDTLRFGKEIDDIFTMDPEKTREKLDRANLPWIQQDLQSGRQGNINDPDGNLLLIGKTEALKKILSGVRIIEQLVTTIEQYQGSDAHCICGHERISHLFIAKHLRASNARVLVNTMRSGNPKGTES
jgi:hypothetical protein